MIIYAWVPQGLRPLRAREPQARDRGHNYCIYIEREGDIEIYVCMYV